MGVTYWKVVRERSTQATKRSLGLDSPVKVWVSVMVFFGVPGALYFFGSSESFKEELLSAAAVAALYALAWIIVWCVQFHGMPRQMHSEVVSYANQVESALRDLTENSPEKLMKQVIASWEGRPNISDRTLSINKLANIESGFNGINFIPILREMKEAATPPNNVILIDPGELNRDGEAVENSKVNIDSVFAYWRQKYPELEGRDE